VIDANTLGQRRRGRRPKPNKRVPLSLLVDPGLRRLLVDTAEENGRSITRQTEHVLEQALKNPEPLLVISGYRPRAAQPDNETRDLDNRTSYLDRSIGARAGAFLEINYPGRGKDERIARDLGISAGMAKMLRQGRAWTVARLDQAIELWSGFRGFVFPAPPSDQIANRLEQLAAGFARLADEFAELRQELRAERPRDSPCGDQAKDRPA
jgi:hypothetical protein